MDGINFNVLYDLFTMIIRPHFDRLIQQTEIVGVFFFMI